MKSFEIIHLSPSFPEAVAQEIRKKRPIQNYVTQLSVESDVDILNPPLIIPSIAAWDMGLGESEVLCHALEMGN